MTKQATPRGTLTKNTQCQQRADDDAGEHRSDKRRDALGEIVLKAMTFVRRSSGVTSAMMVKVTVMMAPPPVPSGRGRR